jgi:hypothetical protein
MQWATLLGKKMGMKDHHGRMLLTYKSLSYLARRRSKNSSGHDSRSRRGRYHDSRSHRCLLPLLQTLLKAPGTRVSNGATALLAIFTEDDSKLDPAAHGTAFVCSGLEESLVTLEPGCNRLVLTMLNRPDWHRMARKLPKVPNQGFPRL